MDFDPLAEIIVMYGPAVEGRLDEALQALSKYGRQDGRDQVLCLEAAGILNDRWEELGSVADRPVAVPRHHLDAMRQFSFGEVCEMELLNQLRTHPRQWVVGGDLEYSAAEAVRRIAASLPRQRPPRALEYIAFKAIPSEHREERLGDLEENYAQTATRFGERSARIDYAVEVLWLIPKSWRQWAIKKLWKLMGFGSAATAASQVWDWLSDRISGDD